MDKQPQNLTEEELLQAAEEAYQQAQADAPVYEESEEEQSPAPPAEAANAPLPDNPPAEEEPKKNGACARVSTTGTVIGIAAGLLLGGTLGFVCKAVPACLILGILLGLLIGLLLDLKTDKQAAKGDPAEQEPCRQTAPSILDESQNADGANKKETETND